MLPYEKVFSRARGQINDPKELSLDDDDLLELYTERLHSAVGNVRLRNLFSKLTLNDQTEEIDWALENTLTGSNAEIEEDFVIELLSLSMVIGWLKPQVESIVYVGMAIGGKEEKMLNNMHKTNVERLNYLEIKLSKMIRDHGYLYNDYLR